MKKNQSGIVHLGLILFVLVAAVVAYAGYKVVKDNSNSNNTASTTPAGASATVQTIRSKADLTTAENSLNSQNISGDLNPSQFDQDVNSLL